MADAIEVHPTASGSWVIPAVRGAIKLKNIADLLQGNARAAN